MHDEVLVGRDHRIENTWRPATAGTKIVASLCPSASSWFAQKRHNMWSRYFLVLGRHFSAYDSTRKSKQARTNKLKSTKHLWFHDVLIQNLRWLVGTLTNLVFVSLPWWKYRYGNYESIDVAIMTLYQHIDGAIMEHAILEYPCGDCGGGKTFLR